MTRVAYLDESHRPGAYLVAVAAVEHRYVATVRHQLRTLAPKQVARRHMNHERDAERHRMLATFRQLPGVEIIVWVETRPGSVQRRRDLAIEGAVTLLLAGGLDRLVLDHVDVSQQRRDRQALGRALRAGPEHHPVTFSHEPAHSTEPMLWVPDAVAWCAGRSDRWRRALDGWVTIHVH